MRFSTFLAGFLALGLTAPALAHPEDEGMNQRRGPSTGELAQAAIAGMVKQRKLPASWNSAKMTSFDYRDRNGGQYVLTYENSAVKAAAKKKLFVVMTTNGKLVSAGHKAS